MRLDLYLKLSRLVPRRTGAKELCDAGEVSVNGQAAKAGREVHPGDRITLLLPIARDHRRGARSARRQERREGRRARAVPRDSGSGASTCSATSCRPADRPVPHVRRPVLAVSLAFIGGVALGAWLPQEPAAWGWAAGGDARVSGWRCFAAGRLAAGSRIGLAVFVVVGIFRLQGDLAPLYAGDDPLAEGDAVASGRIARPAEIRDGETVLHLEQARLRRDGVTVRLELPLQIVVAGRRAKVLRRRSASRRAGRCG